MTGVGSTFAIHFQSKIPRNAADTARNDAAATKAYFTHMLDKGIIYLSPNVSHCWISSPHTAEDIDAYLSATEEFVRGLQALTEDFTVFPSHLFGYAAPVQTLV